MTPRLRRAVVTGALAALVLAAVVGSLARAWS